MLPKLFLTSLVTALFSFLAGSAQTIEHIGQEKTLEIATWNIEWFGANQGPANDALQMSNVAAVISESGIDLWGVQEIADEDDFVALLEMLGDDYDGRLATNSGQQRVGFIFDTNVIRVIQVKHILESFLYEFAGRPPLQLEAEITLPDTSLTITFIVLHMKAFSDEESYQRRMEASIRLKNHIEFSGLDNEPVVVLGDFNDELEESIFDDQVSPYANFVSDISDYFFVSLPLEQAGEGSYCENDACTLTGNLIDHILISNELFDFYASGSAGFIPNLIDAINVYGNTTSDHLPVFGRLDFSQEVTGIEDQTAPLAFVVAPPHPNPFATSSRFSVTQSSQAHLKITVFDVLGREVEVIVDQQHGQSTHTFQFIPPASLPAGTYFLRVESEKQSQILSMLFVR